MDELCCVRCGAVSRLRPVAHRNEHGVCGWVFVCPECLTHVYNAEIRMGLREPILVEEAE